MLKTILTYGIVGGLIVGVGMSSVVIGLGDHIPSPWNMIVGYLIMLVALSTVFLGVKQVRDVDRGGIIGFWPALGIGIGISLIAGVLYVAAWDLALTVTHMDFAGQYADAMIAEQKAKGMTGQALANFTAEMERFKANYANPLFRWPMTFIEVFPVGVLVSLITAAVLRNPRVLPARAA